MPSQEDLAAARKWLVEGLQRQFQIKRLQGLVSAKGLRILAHTCERQLSDPSSPLDMWSHLQADACGTVIMPLLSKVLVRVRRTYVHCK
jgi:hypothetical protein